MLNRIVWNGTIYMYKNGFDNNLKCWYAIKTQPSKRVKFLVYIYIKETL